MPPRHDFRNHSQQHGFVAWHLNSRCVENIKSFLLYNGSSESYGDSESYMHWHCILQVAKPGWYSDRGAYLRLTKCHPYEQPPLRYRSQHVGEALFMLRRMIV